MTPHRPQDDGAWEAKVLPHRAGRGVFSASMSHTSAAHRSPHPDPAPSDKVSWRREIRATRRALDPALRAQRAEDLAEQALGALDERLGASADRAGAPAKLAAYFSSPDEPDTAPLLRRLVQLGHQVYLPVCEPEYRLSWTRWEPGTELRPSAIAPVTEPVGERHGAELFAQIPLLFIPALAIDSAGMRLGQGGGYYDRFLPQLAPLGTRLAALVYSDEFVQAGSFAVDPHDRPVGLVITPDARHELDNGF